MKFYIPGTNRRQTLLAWIAAEQDAGLTVYRNANGDDGAPFVSLSHGEQIEGRWEEMTASDIADLTESLEVIAS